MDFLLFVIIFAVVVSFLILLRNDAHTALKLKLKSHLLPLIGVLSSYFCDVLVGLWVDISENLVE